jgi:hypothetical protein
VFVAPQRGGSGKREKIMHGLILGTFSLNMLRTTGVDEIVCEKPREILTESDGLMFCPAEYENQRSTCSGTKSGASGTLPRTGALMLAKSNCLLSIRALSPFQPSSLLISCAA